MDMKARTQARELFLAACQRPPENRTAFLREACGSDSELYDEVESLLSYRDDDTQTVVAPGGDATAGKPSNWDRFIPGTVLDGRYRIVTLLGRGGMGEVYRADDLRLGVSVALKFLPEWLEAEDEMRRRFLEEVKLARVITHPNVCRVYDVGEADGHLFISMEYIDGVDMATLIERDGPMPSAKAVEVLRQVLEGLGAAHEQGILHRDLKPSNLMIDTGGRARITDFGLAIPFRLGALSDAEVMTGTPAYMAPEQLAGWEVTIKSDLYALGLVFYELTSGRQAFPARSPKQMLRLRQETVPEPPSHLAEGLDPGVEEIILRLLEKDAARRPESARDVLAALPGGDSPPVLMTLLRAELPELPARYDDKVKALLDERGGQQVGEAARGGRLQLVFERPWNAVCWALAYQRTIEELSGRRLAARVGIHLTEVARLPGGEPRVDPAALELAGRLSALARGRQTLLTRGAFDLARQGADGSPTWLAHGAYRLEGWDEAIEVFEVGREGSAPLTPPEDSPMARRVAHEDAILGWRPAAGQSIESRPHWRLDRKLGEGGYGEVWLASNERTGERRAFKFCFEARRLRALKREITLVRLLKEGLGDRDDIARILDWNFETVPYFIESEYTSGGDLVEWAERQGGLTRIPLEVRLSIIAQVAEALSAAHSVGILHKDVKPGNVLIHVDTEKRPRTRLADFGIGLLTDESLLNSPGGNTTPLSQKSMTLFTVAEGTSSGTPLYRAPELLEGKAATVQADIYAVGVMLYQVVVGDFRRALGPGWERDVDDDLLREDIAAAVDKSPRRRLGNAVRLAQRLGELDERRRERAAEEKAREEARRTRAELERSQRRRKLAAVAIVALTVFAAAMLWQARRVAREARTAQQVADFLVRIFEVSDPDSGRGRDIKARELLEQGAAQIEWELEDQPEVRARLMHTIGVVYRSLGLYEDAAPMLETALLIRRELRGEEHREIAESLDALALLAHKQGKYQGAESLGRDALAMRQRLLGDEHLDVATSLNTLAGVLSQRGDYEAAERLYREALDMRRRILGNEHPDLAENLNNLAAMLEKKGDFEAAERLYREALGMRRRLLGDEHPYLARSLNNLAALFVATGNYAAAEPLYREALDMRRHLLGDEHPDLARSLNNLAQLLQLKGDLDAAEPLYREALAMRRRLLSDEHPSVATSLMNLAWLLSGQGDLAAAEPLYREALAIRRRFLGNDHDRVANSLNHLARLLWDMGEVEEAEQLYLEALAIQRQLQGDKHPDVTYIMNNLASFYEAQGRLEEAESYRDHD